MFGESTPRPPKGASLPYRKTYRLIKLDRDDSLTKLEDIVQEDGHEYAAEDVKSIVSTVEAGEKNGFLSVTVATVLIGFVRFLQGYYLIVGNKEVLEGTIAGHNVYSLENTIMIPVWNSRPLVIEQSFFGRVKQTFNNLRVTQTPLEASEARYRALFSQIDFTKDFYFSHTYDITRSVQKNYVKQRNSGPASMYVWNHFLMKEFQNCVRDRAWCTEFVYGSFEQQPCLLFGEEIRITVVARRSRHFAGTRYLKRGISDEGKVANDVEVEQILEHVGDGRITSHVQNRGSIPVFWTQKTSATDPKPDIILPQSKGAETIPLPLDPFFFSTRSHLNDMISRYGAPVTCLNLVRLQEKKPREVLVGGRFREAIQSINMTTPPRFQVTYLELDYKHLQKAGHGHYHLDALAECAEQSLQETSYFYYNSKRDLPSNGNTGCSILGQNEEAMVSIARKYFHGGCKLAHVISKLKGRSLGTFMFWRYHGEMIVSVVGEDSYSIKHVVLWRESHKYVLQAGKRVSTLYDVMINMPGLRIGLINRRTEFHSPQEEESILSYKRSGSSRNEAKEDSNLQSKPTVMLQSGVLRVNCIDCLDRTNVAQFYMGLHVLGKQLWSMGIDMRGQNEDGNVTLDNHSPIVRLIMLIYERLGDRISMQYAGSQAHKKVSGQPVGKDKNSNSRSAEVLTSIRRYYSNSFTDKLKQDAINLVLGHFIPSIHTSEHYIKSIMPLEGPPKNVWERGGDYYWHNTMHLKAYIPGFEKISQKWWEDAMHQRTTIGPGENTPTAVSSGSVVTDETVDSAQETPNGNRGIVEYLPVHNEKYESFDNVRTPMQIAELASDQNRHGLNMSLSRQLETEKDSLSQTERGLKKDVLHVFTKLLNGDVFVDTDHEIIKPEFPLWKDRREYEEPYTSISKDGEFIISQPSWDPFTDQPPLMEDTIFGTYEKSASLPGSRQSSPTSTMSFTAEKVKRSRVKSIGQESAKASSPNDVESPSDTNFMISNQNTIGKHNNKQFMQLLSSNSIDYNTLINESAEDEEVQEINDAPFSGFSLFRSSNTDTNESKTALGFDTLTKQVSGKYFPRFASPSVTSVGSSKYRPSSQSEVDYTPRDSAKSHYDSDRKTETGQEKTPLFDHDGDYTAKTYAMNKHSAYVAQSNDYFPDNDDTLKGSSYTNDLYSTIEGSVGIYKSYVAIDRYTDACYRQDADKTIFDVTGLRRDEIEKYNTKYSDPREFLVESKERSGYFNKPERIMGDYMKNLLVVEEGQESDGSSKVMN